MMAENDTEVLKIIAETKDPEVSAAVCNILSSIAPEVLTRVVGAGGVETIGVAEINDIPTYPNVTMISLFGFVGGFCLAVFLVMLFDFLDNTVKTSEDIEKRFKKPVIEEIHSMHIHQNKSNKKNKPGRTFNILPKDAPFHIKESYKALRSNFAFSLAVSDKKIVIITSANPGEGKSTTSANLAVSLAQTGQKVLLIDADLRKPVQNEIFKLKNKNGLSSIIGGKTKFEECVNRSVSEHLDILTSGAIPPNPSELLGSKKTAELFEKLADEYSYIIVDTPPLNVVSDALSMSSIIAGIIMVTKHASTTFEDIAKATKSIEIGNIKLLGIVINNIENKKFSLHKGYGKYGYHKYGHYAKYASYDSYGSYDNVEKAESKS